MASPEENLLPINKKKKKIFHIFRCHVSTILGFKYNEGIYVNNYAGNDVSAGIAVLLKHENKPNIKTQETSNSQANIKQHT